MTAYLFTRRGRLRVVEYHEACPPSIGGLRYNVAERGPGESVEQALTSCRPWICLGRLDDQPWTRRARLAVEQWLGGQC